MSKLSRWAVNTLGGALVVGIQAAIQVEHLSPKAAAYAFASAVGGALLLALKNFDPELIRKEELPKWMQDFLNGDENSVPPAAPVFSEPAAVGPALATTMADDLNQ